MLFLLEEALVCVLEEFGFDLGSFEELFYVCETEPSDSLRFGLVKQGVLVFEGPHQKFDLLLVFHPGVIGMVHSVGAGMARHKLKDNYSNSGYLSFWGQLHEPGAFEVELEDVGKDVLLHEDVPVVALDGTRIEVLLEMLQTLGILPANKRGGKIALGLVHGRKGY